MRETARLVERDYKEVHRNLKELEAIGVIEFATDGNSKRPILREGARGNRPLDTSPIDSDTPDSTSPRDVSVRTNQCGSDHRSGDS
ncbi:HVO_A0114 family putative DNA-binding protein [Haloarcula japonica]